MLRIFLRVAIMGIAIAICATPGSAADDVGATGDIFRRDNLIAWCIVPFDSQKRGPEERAAMLQRLGFKHFAYDYRAEHVPTFDAEIEACRRHGVSLDAWWFPRSLGDEARKILDLCRKHDLRPQLWIAGDDSPAPLDSDLQRRVEQEAAWIRPLAEAAAAQGMTIGLYNHGGWFGEPETQLAIIKQLGLPNVGMVYNFHHGHEHFERMATLLPQMLPHLLCVNLNGMMRNGDKHGQKILQLGHGSLDLQMLRMIRDSGYRGPIGILGHTQDDAEARLQDNLDGLAWLVPQLDGNPPTEKPHPRTPVPKADAPVAVIGATSNKAGWLVSGRDEYRTRPLSVACRAVLNSREGYNILVACDTKQSSAHWELFTLPGTGALAAYLPGYEPDHVRTDRNIADGNPHAVAMTLESGCARLHVDGKLAADQKIQFRGGPVVPGDFAIGQLVEGNLTAVGTIEFVRLTRGANGSDSSTSSAANVDADTLGLWRFPDPQQTVVADASASQNPARRAAAAVPGKASEPPAGVHLKPIDARLKATLIDRSANDVYLGVKVDATGNVFVGGREAVFVFEPDGNGYAKRRELLRFPPDSIIMGLEFRNDDLYVLTDNALYLVPEGRVRRDNLQPQRILWGLPLDLHVSFHCLAWGPDGDLYLTHGDPLLQYGDWARPDHWGHWTLYCGRENRPLPCTGQGAVLRMKPGGTDVRIVARGLRGPVGLAFDRDGNLFTNDNDHEGRADLYAPSRLLHVVAGIDFAWPRGWAASKSPDRCDLIEPMCDLGRGVPCDLVFYDRPLLADVVGDRLLMCRWDRQNVSAYRLERRGSTFGAVEEAIAVGDENCRPVGISTDRDGRLFITALYMTGNMAAPDCVSDLIVIDRAGAAPAADAPHPVAPPASQSPDALADARSDDLYRRQLAVTQLARRSTLAELTRLAHSEDEAMRLAGILAVGRKLTVPEPNEVPPASLKLSYPNESIFFHRMQRFYGADQEIDLADFGRIGSFTIAEWWATVERSPEHESLFALLVAALDDDSERVRLQAAYFLSLLGDRRSEPLVERVRRDAQLRPLLSARAYPIEKVWEVGPFDATAAATGSHGPERERLDLSATYDGRAWQERDLSVPSADSRQGASANASTYYSFRIVSGSRQTALLTVAGGGKNQIWQNEAPIDVAVVDAESRRWIVDLQPGSNEFLLRAPRGALIGAELRAGGDVAASRSERVDSAMLAERLRSASTETSQAVPVEFAAIDRDRAVADGDPVEGRRLFGTLGCVKCHAIAPDQKSAGAPNLSEAKRRFTIPYLVESVLLPSRQVANVFRAQAFVTGDGRTITGLVTSETDDVVELLLPDATRQAIAKTSIEERTSTALSPMPQGLVKSPAELRHLMSYLLSDRPLPP